MEVREGALLEHQDDHSATVSVHTLALGPDRGQEHAGSETRDNPAFLTSLSSSSDPGEQLKVIQQAEEPNIRLKPEACFA